MMSARHKLNKVHILGTIGLAAILGGAAQSWTIFVIAALVLVAVAIFSRDIRFKERRRRKLK